MMRLKLEGVKVDSSDIEAKMSALFGAARSQKARSKTNHHQRDWRRQSSTLQQERAEIEKAHLLWQQEMAPPRARGLRGCAESSSSQAPAADTHSVSVARGDPEALLVEMFSAEALADSARREWSIEMRWQLRDLRELCLAPASETVPAKLLLQELRQSLGAQSQQLGSKAEVLEAEIAAHAAIFTAPDDDPSFATLAEGGESSSFGGVASTDLREIAEIAALSGAFISPPELRSAGEQLTLEELGRNFLQVLCQPHPPNPNTQSRLPNTTRKRQPQPPIPNPPPNPTPTHRRKCITWKRWRR